MADKMHIGGVLHRDNLVLISVLAMPVRPGTAGAITSAMGEAGVNLEFIVQTVGLSGRDHIVFCVQESEAERAMAILKELRTTVKARKITRQDEVGIVFAFGPDFQHKPGIAGEVFQTLGQEGINIIAISTSISTLSCVVEQERVAEAVAALRRKFITP